VLQHTPRENTHRDHIYRFNTCKGDTHIANTDIETCTYINERKKERERERERESPFAKTRESMVSTDNTYIRIANTYIKKIHREDSC